MASENATKTVNGNYGSQQPYSLPEQPLPSQATNNNTTGTAAAGSFGDEPTSVPNAGNSSTTGTSEGNAGVPKDEVGWYFVEQYYTTLSKTPEKLHVRKSSFRAERPKCRRFMVVHDLQYHSSFTQSALNSYRALKPRKYQCLLVNG